MSGGANVPQFQSEVLCSRHNRADFSCGVEPLDDYLRRQAGQDLKKRVAAVFVLTEDGKAVAGYYTLSQFSVELGELPAAAVRRLPRYPQVPATLIGRLAVDRHYQGKGVGELLLMDALRRCHAASREIASAAVVVDAKDARARAFYRKYGFLDLPAFPNRLFIPMKTIEQLLSE